jgi:hypothetical protein
LLPIAGSTLPVSIIDLGLTFDLGLTCDLGLTFDLGPTFDLGLTFGEESTDKQR